MRLLVTYKLVENYSIAKAGDWASQVFIRERYGLPRVNQQTLYRTLERLAKAGKDKAICDELQHQLDGRGLMVKRGVMQDATFITADPGHAKADKPRGEEAKTRRNKEATWTKKLQKSYFGYKLHSKVDIDYGLIRDIKTTTASVHDSRVDLSRPGEVVYRDSGYFGVGSRGYDVYMFFEQLLFQY